MDARIELRKKDFKKTFDNPRRRREEQQVQIRRQNREARLSKKRQAALEDLPETNVTEMDGGVTLSVEDIPRMALQVMSDDAAQQLEGTQNFRKLLSIAKNPPIKEVIQSGVTPRLVELLQDDSRPDVQFQAAWALTNIASGTQEQTQVVVKHGAVPIFVRLLSSNKWDVREQAIWALGNIAGDCHTCRDLVFQEGALEPLLHQLKICLNYKQHGAVPNELYDQIKPTMLTNATWTLSNLCRGKPRCQLQWIAPALPILKELIYLNDTEVLADACWALSYLSEGNDEQSSNAIGMILGAGVASRLVQLLQHSSQNVQTPALRAVGNIVSGNDQQTETMIVSGCISALKALLTRAKKTLVRKETCWTISNITAGNRSQIQAVIDEGLIPLLVEMHPHADSEVKKEIGWALANAASGASAIQVQYLVEVKVVPPLCKSLNVGDDSSLVGAALEALLNILSVGKQLQQEINSSENPYAVLVEEANAYPLLEQLQYAPVNSKEYILAMKIMTTYLSFEEDEDDQSHTNAESYEQFGQGTTDATIRNNQNTPTGAFNFTD